MMTKALMNRQWNDILNLVPFCIGLTWLVAVTCGWAEAQIELEITEPQSLEMVVGKSAVLKSPVDVTRVSVGNPEVVDYVVLSSRQVYLAAKSIGTTNLTVWHGDKVIGIYDLRAAVDSTGLKRDLHRLVSEEKNVRVSPSGEGLTLSGTVSSNANLQQIVRLAEAYAPEKVTNLLQVGGVHQVMLEVRVAEMSRSMAKRLGINFTQVEDGNFGMTLLDNLHQIVLPNQATVQTARDSNPEIQNAFGEVLGDSVTGLFRMSTALGTLTAFIDALKEEGLVRVLAEPTLVCLSGQSAEFLAGGEFPVPVPQGLGTVAIEWKPYGVGLQFEPVVMNGNKINMMVSPVVSELDFSTAVEIQGVQVPGLETRKASTMVELADGQSFAIAGLLKEETREQVSKMPYLGEIPILGALFRSSSYQRNETELVILVTPRLAKPIDADGIRLPSDRYTEPSDFELYFLGKLEGDVDYGSNGLDPFLLDSRGGLDGPFGHMMP